ncbi:MAG TPA: hypothetical protein VE344_04215 [Methylomirabilota bacterium]|nr:hypothetical protein [Methylomirabilota bacterium]
MPVKDQPHGLLWIILFLIFMEISMAIGYLTSFAILAAALKWRAGWSTMQIRKLIFESEVPSHWLKPE